MSNQHGDLHQPCACRCGKARFQLRGRPLARFVCHCTVCQEVYDRPYADVVAVRLGSFELEPEQEVGFRTYKPPPALSRGTCGACGAPVIGLLEKMPGVRIAFVPTENFSDPSVLPPPRMHIFYNRRVRDVDDDLPHYGGFVRSELAVARALAGGLMR